MRIGTLSSSTPLIALSCALALLLAPAADARRKKRKKPRRDAPPAQVAPEVVEVTLGRELWPLVDTDAPRVLLLPLAGAGVEGAELERLSGIVAETLAARPRVHLEGGAASLALLGAELGDEAARCARDVECAAELAGAFGARYALIGSVDLVEGDRVASLSLVDVDRAEAATRTTRLLEGTADLASELRGASLLALRPLLEDGRATLTVRSSEAGAEVRLDGAVLGPAPIEGREVAGGPHLVEVSKEGFVPFARVVELAPGERRALDAALAPGEALRQAREDAAGLGQLLAWSVVGGGALLMASGGAALGGSALRADELNRAIREANERGGFTPDEKAAIDGETLLVHVGTGAGIALLITGGALATTAVAMLLLGDEPAPSGE